ncbi:cell envelope integrity protein CreD [Bacteroides sp. 214]|uniref:cell envelope integrity protein CreD n=1 Tax=Bacteroides sp. 214 TaxID=2302935 RepID=UPI0013D71D92|nr:cell envelope integrity protein CreD [Bacteroides sp. 214]NDW11475.1 cell envelope integrity protein CreD [Bacteroides sp. 214]
MEAKEKKMEKLSQSITVKLIVVCVLTLLLLIPTAMIESLISERKQRSEETVEKINNKWSRAQVLCAPVLSIPFTTTHVDANGTVTHNNHLYHITPETLNVDATLFPEERHYGIYKTILYKSELTLNGAFDIPELPSEYNGVLHWHKAYIRLGFSDLRGVTNNIELNVNGTSFSAAVGNANDRLMGKELFVYLDSVMTGKPATSLEYSCTINLNGSSSLNFIPIGKTTKVHVSGAWNAPGYIGNFTPDHTLTESGFEANWSVLRFNRSIPETWVDSYVDGFGDTSFGVNLVDVVDHYQQNTRSAKYALMFVALTFVVFFFVEVLTKRRIHPIQYLLVGIALILFYSLLLSISEQISFAWAYLIASVSTIGMITLYTKSIFKSWRQTGILTFTLSLLYIFLYVILQLEDIALLIGSIGLFAILGVIMYCSRKISWYKTDV